ncbi:MAG: hypothetical protein IJU45_00805 [Clostridia bacterium]|nr:hypothetical protein [Clostridia bacterium]
MDIIEKLLQHTEWLRFKDYKIGGGHLTPRQQKEISDFIDGKKYPAAAQKIAGGGFFSIPEAVKVSKIHSDKKRTVFVFSEDENYIQKFIAFQLLDYDYIFADNLYSFRRDMGVKKAISRLMYHENISEMYSYKLDISDYFNSVDAQKLLPVLKNTLQNEKKLFAVIEDMLTNPLALIDGKEAAVKKGILAGSPVSGFLANLYLNELDKYFESAGVLYARYSDDIIVFAQSQDLLNSYINIIVSFLSQKGLEVNNKKVSVTSPHEKWTFLGFSYHNSVIDISDISKQKLKNKMRRKARALLRWKKRKNASDEQAVRAFIRHFNKKFYSNDMTNEITWCRWYFPVITTSEGLKEIDSYMQQCIRYIATSKQNKKKYDFRYSDMKKLGYKTLVNSYYKFRENN